MTLAAHSVNDDAALLREYAQGWSEAAFADLVQRHVNLVHSAALRQVGGDAATAQDVTQDVFTELARQAARLTRHPTLTGWLYTTTHRMAAGHIRSEIRRHRREQEAHAMQELLRESAPIEPDLDWAQLRPVLDAAMHELNETDRLAVLLRHFEQRPLAEIGVRLGLSENAARMRVDRALDKLRAKLAKHGLTSTATALTAALTGPAVMAAPAGLASTVTASAINAVASTTSTFGILTMMTSTQLKLGAAAAVVAFVATQLIIQQRSVSGLRTENLGLRQQLARADDQERSAAARSVQNEAELARLRAAQTELLRLRGEVAQLLAIQSSQPVPAAKPEPEPEPATTPSMDDLMIADQGTGTPENTSASFIWALAARQKDRFVELVQLPDDLPTTEASQHLDSLYRRMSNTYGRWQFGAVERTRISDDGTVKLDLGFRDPDTGRQDALLIVLREYDSGWKVVIDDVPRGDPPGGG